ncbi:MAG TPA: YciI family protein [Hyphomicrobiales bacterium]|nr:YciI family protein [Hyphomicrobiales bacterium]
MKYMLMIYEDEKTYGTSAQGDPMNRILEKHMAYTEKLGKAYAGGAGLKGTAAATTVRTVGGSKTVHDGPFAETKEQLGGYYLIDVPDLDAAIAVARDVPLRKDGSIEIRPVMGG